MNGTELAQIEEHLVGRVEEIASDWLGLINSLSPVAPERDATLARLEEFTDALIRQLVSEPFRPEGARKIGSALEAWDNWATDSITQICAFLAEQLPRGLSPEQQAVLQPRVTMLLVSLTQGFFISKAERARQFGMSAMSKMGHDLKTPINAVTGFSRVILKGIDGPITEFQQQDLTSIYEAGQKLLTMINDLFEAAKADAAKTNIYARAFEVSDLLGDVMHTAQPILARNGHTLTVTGEAELGSMSGGASEARWIVLSLLFYIGRLFENGDLSVTASRRKVDNVDRIIFEISGGLPENAELSLEEGDLPASDDVGLIVSKQFCKDMGGGYTLVREGNVITSSLWLPARIAESLAI